MPWTDQAREAARQRCIERRPSQYSTGPRTQRGKAISSKNNLQHALYSKDFVLQILAYQRHRQEICEAERQQIKEILKPIYNCRKKSLTFIKT